MPLQPVGDVKLNYQVDGSGKPIVFIHGLGSSRRDWEYQIDFFSKRYQVLTYDVRGHGASDNPPGPFSMEQFSKEAEALIRSQVMAPAHVVGISMGGMIALQLALDSPDIVRSLVVVNAGPDMVIKNFKQRRQVWQRFLLVRLFGMRKVGEVLGSRIFPGEDQVDLRNLFIERWAENDSQAWQESLKAVVGWSVIDRLGEIKCPVLVISADQDYTPVSEKEAYVTRFPDARLVVVADSHHATPVDQPEKFNQILMDFITGI